MKGWTQKKMPSRLTKANWTRSKTQGSEPFLRHENYPNQKSGQIPLQTTKLSIFLCRKIEVLILSRSASPVYLIGTDEEGIWPSLTLSSVTPLFFWGGGGSQSFPHRCRHKCITLKLRTLFNGLLIPHPSVCSILQKAALQKAKKRIQFIVIKLNKWKKIYL